MNYNHDHVQELLDESMGLIGMLDEIRCKGELFKNREPTEELQNSVDQMQNDLTKYSCRLNTIYEELYDYGIISEVQ